ncbi:uncharacterized protein [Montipora capricornis]|uniref:uncharacterized protein n=1 Tax=Montipora capricornis TaxID=246305 RepID=UPI0035F1F8DE
MSGWNGPMFLSLPEQQWPARPDTSLIEESVLSENKGELKKEAVPSRQQLSVANTGVDFAGPLNVKNVFGGESKMHKVYIALYTCSSTRAVHLDLVPSLDAQAFIRSLKRFFARRGVNQLFISDNAKAFKSQEVQQLVKDLGIDCKFNLPRAPWWGGFFRTNGPMYKRLFDRKPLVLPRLTYEELLTVLTEVQGVLNSRPLTYVYGDDIEEPLTPSHLMIGRRLRSRNPKTAPDGVSCSSSVTEVCKES